MDRHLSDGREWLIGGAAPKFADVTLCVAIAFSKYPTNNTPLDERFEFIDKIWRRWVSVYRYRLEFSESCVHTQAL